MNAMTEQNLSAALAGESQAHVKYLAFAEAARREGKPNVARLFEAVSYAELVHATNHLRALGGIGASVANLEAALGGETFEIEQMYPAYTAVAKDQGETRALRSMNYALEAEKIHAVIYKDTGEKVAAGADFTDQAVYICPICGHTVIGSAPHNCPICNAKGETFKKF
jgi:rubrerythrin